MSNDKNYVDNDELEQELKKHIETGNVSERLGQILIDLHDHILQHKNFRGYRQDLKDEMKSYSLYRIIKRGLETWNPEKGGKAFSYLTRAIFQNFITIISRYYRRLNLHQEYIKNELASLDYNNPVWKKFASDFKLSESQGVIMDMTNTGENP
jgi:hypothetical protein